MKFNENLRSLRELRATLRRLGYGKDSVCAIEVVGAAGTTSLALDLVGKQGTVSIVGAGLEYFNFLRCRRHFARRCRFV